MKSKYFCRINTTSAKIKMKVCVFKSHVFNMFNKSFITRLNKVSYLKGCKGFHSSICRFAKQPIKRKYMSRMFLSPLNATKTDGFSCRSQELFLYNEILQPCHAGAYYYLPLGQRSLEKLIRLIDEELQDTGAQKISMPSLIQASLWKQTGRWDTEELFKLKDRHSKEYCLGPTHEELVTNLINQFSVISHKRLPILFYQITKKFRDEKHPKYALLRGREFEMKDMYTFDVSEEAARDTYKQVCQTYDAIFRRLGLDYQKAVGATGNIGGKLSHEFHLRSDIGEDTVYTCDKCGFGINSELMEHTENNGSCACPECNGTMKQESMIEVGHAFLLGTKYSKALDCKFYNQDGKKELMQMGCYGLGVSRILQASVEVLAKDDRIGWPSIIAPYQICILPQKTGYMSDKFNEIADQLSDTLTSLPNLRGEVVVDDRLKLTVGKRLHQAKRQGYPHIIIIGRKTLEESLYEVVDNALDTTDFLSLEQLVDKYSSIETI